MAWGSKWMSEARVVDRLGHDAVDQLDDGSLVDLLPDVADLVGADLRRSARCSSMILGHVVVQSPQLGDLVEDVLLGGDGRLDVVAGEDAQVVDGEDVGRIDHRHQEGVVVDVADRDGGVAAGVLLGDEAGGRGIDRDLGEVEKVHP